MQPLRIAIVGLGKMGLLHASILKMIPGVEIAALCDKSYFLRKIIKKMFKKARIVSDIYDLADLSLDSIYITTPIPIHFPLIKALYSENITKNIFVEKTLASSYDQAKELCDLARSGGINMVGYMKRFAVSFKRAKEILDREMLGDITSFEAFAYSSDFLDVKGGSKAPAARGGVLRDLGSHVIDLSLLYFDDFEVESAILQSLTGENSEDYAKISVKNSTLKGQFNFSWCEQNYRMPSFGLDIYGSKGTLKVTDETVELNKAGKTEKWFKHDLDDHVKYLLGDPEYYREDEYFVNSLLAKKNAEPSFLTASKADYIIDQVKMKAGKNA